MRNDPHELNDLSLDPTQQDRITTMMAQLEDWKKVVGDPLINDQPEASYDTFFLSPGTKCDGYLT